MKLHYRIIGEGPVIIILHGLFGMSDNWQSFARRLSSNGYKVLLPDLRNHGHSPHSDAHNYELMAGDIAALIQELKLEKPVLMGHSMGGKVCLKFLNNYTDIATKVIVVDIAPWQYPVHHREILNALLSLKTETLTSRQEAENALKEYIDNPAILQFLLKNLYRTLDHRFAWRFNLKVLDEQIEEVGRATWPEAPINTPVLFVSGENSGYVDADRMSEIKQWYPSAELIHIPGAGHWVHAEQPELLLHEIIHWIEPPSPDH